MTRPERRSPNTSTVFAAELEHSLSTKKGSKSKVPAKTASQPKDVRATLKKLLTVSKRVRIDMLREYVQMDKDQFLEKLVEWAAEYNFTIDGDFIITASDDAEKLVQNIDAMFDEWEAASEVKGSKM